MGANSSSSPPPEPPPLAQRMAQEEVPRLTRRLSAAALGAISEQAIKARNEAYHYKDMYDEALQAVDELTARVEQQQLYAIAAVTVCSAVAAAAAGALAGRAAQKASATAIARLSQEMVDLRRRGATELEKAEKFGSAKLAKSLIPALDAMDALCASTSAREGKGGGGGGGGEPSADDEGKLLTRAALHDALRSNGIEVVAPVLGDKFDVASMEAMMTVPVAEGKPPGFVEALLRPGYVMHGERVLRAAQVGVGAAGEGGGGESDGGGGS